jgi:hypothetical protein
MRRSASPAPQSSTALANLTCLLGIGKLARKLPDPGSGARFDVGFLQKSKAIDECALSTRGAGGRLRLCDSSAAPRKFPRLALKPKSHR